MDARDVFEQLNDRERLPVEAILAARERREAMVPLFLRRIEETSLADSEPADAQALFVAFHLLGEWREKTAYRPLVRWLSQSRISDLLGDAITETSHRVMAAVFDGDPEPLHRIIRDPDVDEYVRYRMIYAIVMLTRRGELSRADTRLFLQDCFSRLEPRHDCAVWPGWADAISILGLAELEPLVEEAFARESIDETWMSLEDFQEDLRHATAHPDAEPPVADGELTLFDDTIGNLSSWVAFGDQEQSDADELEDVFGPDPAEPVRNPFRDVGRNDPCPCGSGRKFKKCCLNADRDGRSPSIHQTD
jgi:hypothetical protein